MNASGEDVTKSGVSKSSWEPEDLTVLRAGDEDYFDDDLVGDEDDGSDGDELEGELEGETPESPGEEEDR